jgi:hypothetical protein
MERERLINLRKIKQVLFNSPIKLLELTGEVLFYPSSIPIVVGHPNFGDSEQKIYQLGPATASDELTVRNFLEGLRKVEEEYKSNSEFFKRFNSQFVYNGALSLHYANQDSQVIEISLKNGESATYNLDIFLSREQKYGAQAKTNGTKLDDIMEPHIGPSLHYEKTLI